MEQFFDKVLGFIDSIGSVIEGLFTSLGLLISYLYDIIPSIFVIFSYLPPLLLTACILTFSLGVLKLFAGR